MFFVIASLYIELLDPTSIQIKAEWMGQFYNTIIQICVSYVACCTVLCEQDSAKLKCIFDQNQMTKLYNYIVSISLIFNMHNALYRSIPQTKMKEIKCVVCGEQ